LEDAECELLHDRVGLSGELNQLLQFRWVHAVLQQRIDDSALLSQTDHLLNLHDDAELGDV
jgi:hypothetical protein